MVESMVEDEDSLYPLNPIEEKDKQIATLEKNLDNLKDKEPDERVHHQAEIRIAGLQEELLTVP